MNHYALFGLVVFIGLGTLALLYLLDRSAKKALQKVYDDLDSGTGRLSISRADEEEGGWD
jgi:hypothetical protein